MLAAPAGEPTDGREDRYRMHLIRHIVTPNGNPVVRFTVTGFEARADAETAGVPGSRYVTESLPVRQIQARPAHAGIVVWGDSGASTLPYLMV
jgi:hypothetical protein